MVTSNSIPSPANSSAAGDRMFNKGIDAADRAKIKDVRTAVLVYKALNKEILTREIAENKEKIRRRRGR